MDTKRKNKMILIDYSQVAIANILSFKQDVQKGRPMEEVSNIIRHAILSTIKYYKKKFSADYGDLVICADGKDVWRKVEFPLYKAHRKKDREADPVDWKLIFETMSDVREDLVKHFPYKVLHINHAEADDVIATLVKERPLEKHMIVSSDKDFKQLQKYGNVEQYSPLLKKQVNKSSVKEAEQYIIEHIVRGDSGDGVPNVLSPDDIFNKDERQKPITKKILNNFLEKGFNACENDEQKKNYLRNQKLVCLDSIPKHIADDILNAYNNVKPTGDKMTIYNYLIEKRCSLLLQEIEEF